MPDEKIQPQEIVFPNNNGAKLVSVSRGTPMAGLIERLGISPPKNLILLIGGADKLDEKLTSRLTQLFSRGIARAAADAEALIIDGGTQAGIMQIMGQSIVDRGRKSSLLGVAPAGKVTYPGGPPLASDDSAPLDPNHSHFVLVDGKEWGSETETLFELAAAFKVPVLAIFVNGGAIAKDELLQSVRRNWPVIVIEGSGRLADEVVALKKEPSQIEDPTLAEIVEEGDLRIFPITGALEDFERMLFSQSPNIKLLRAVWQRFATYDTNAVRLQTAFNKIQRWMLVLGLIAVFLVVFQKQGQELVKHQRILDNLLDWLRYPIIVIPILTAILLAYYNKFRPASKWILLRGSAEAIKREIYRYRSRTGDYSKDRLTTNSRDDVFHERLEPVSRRLMQTDVNHGALKPYDGVLPPKEVAQQNDDGFSFLTPERYIELRLEDQLNYYSKKTPKLEKQIKQMQVAILVAGGVGTLLAAVGAQLWVALTTALATALTAWLASRQPDETLVRYNQSAADLANVRDWWTKLSPAAKRNPKNIDQLVEVTEKVLETELSGWVQRMEDALAQLKAEEEKGEQPGGDNSQPKNEGILPPPPQPDTIPKKPEPADSSGQQGT
ncbi:MAG TPA: DUF4231 domain-containing protein [Terriglobales bacterium]|nr:DUF4231 domain-containing protein [Terriglobales bacterium]